VEMEIRKGLHFWFNEIDLILLGAGERP